jgi:hypothetical protein
MKFERLNSRTASAFAAAACIVLGLAVSWKGWRTGSLDDMAMGFVLFLCAGFGRVIFKRNEDGDQMRLSLMYILIAMTAVLFAIVSLMYT